MEGIQSTQQSTTSKTATQTSGTPSTTGDPTEFEVTLKAFVSPNQANEISEEDLFSALVQERIKTQKGEEALAKFKTLLDESLASLRKPDGYVPVEDATKLALTKFRDSGELTEEETDTLYSQAFSAAQLDGNSDALFDNRGGADDHTIAVATLEQALLASRLKIEKFDSGEEAAAMRSVTEASAGKSAFSHGNSSEPSGAGGFLFKPISDSDGKLAVLLPPGLSGLVDSVRLIGADGSILETGRYSGNGNGGREHFRFSKPGGAYPDGLTVEARLTTGELVKYFIQETSQRTEDASSSAPSDETLAPTTSPASDPAKESSKSPSRESGGSRDRSANQDLSL